MQNTDTIQLLLFQVRFFSPLGTEQGVMLCRCMDNTETQGLTQYHGKNNFNQNFSELRKLPLIAQNSQYLECRDSSLLTHSKSSGTDFLLPRTARLSCFLQGYQLSLQWSIKLAFLKQHARIHSKGCTPLHRTREKSFSPPPLCTQTSALEKVTVSSYQLHMFKYISTLIPLQDCVKPQLIGLPQTRRVWTYYKMLFEIIASSFHFGEALARIRDQTPAALRRYWTHAFLFRGHNLKTNRRLFCKGNWQWA